MTHPALDRYDHASAAWHAPEPRRFDSAAAHDGADEENLFDFSPEAMRWMVIVGGGIFAAVVGAMLGGAISL